MSHTSDLIIAARDGSKLAMRILSYDGGKGWTKDETDFFCLAFDLSIEVGSPKAKRLDVLTEKFERTYRSPF
jgi:hypothetical protein